MGPRVRHIRQVKKLSGMTPITLNSHHRDQVAPDDIAIGAIAAGSKPMTQDDHAGIPGFASSPESASGWTDSKEREEL